MADTGTKNLGDVLYPEKANAKGTGFILTRANEIIPATTTGHRIDGWDPQAHANFDFDRKVLERIQAQRKGE